MAAETPSEAANEFLSPLRRALSCITGEDLRGGNQPNRPTVMEFSAADERGFIRLRSEHSALEESNFLEFRFIHGYVIAEDAAGWAVHTTQYTYEFQLNNGLEVVSYHYDPRGTSKVKTPHMHVKSLTRPLPLSRAHFPTGRVSIEDVIRFAITELRVRPRHRDGEWQARLVETEEGFKTKRRW